MFFVELSRGHTSTTECTGSAASEEYKGQRLGLLLRLRGEQDFVGAGAGEGRLRFAVFAAVQLGHAVAWR